MKKIFTKIIVSLLMMIVIGCSMPTDTTYDVYNDGNDMTPPVVPYSEPTPTSKPTPNSTPTPNTTKTKFVDLMIKDKCYVMNHSNNSYSPIVVSSLFSTSSLYFDDIKINHWKYKSNDNNFYDLNNTLNFDEIKNVEVEVKYTRTKTSYTIVTILFEVDSKSHENALYLKEKTITYKSGVDKIDDIYNWFVTRTTVVKE